MESGSSLKDICYDPDLDQRGITGGVRKFLILYMFFKV